MAEAAPVVIYSLTCDEDWEERDVPIMLAFSVDALKVYAESRFGPINWTDEGNRWMGHREGAQRGRLSRPFPEWAICREPWVDESGQEHGR